MHHLGLLRMSQPLGVLADQNSPDRSVSRQVGALPAARRPAEPQFRADKKWVGKFYCLVRVTLSKFSSSITKRICPKCSDFYDFSQ